MKTLNFIAAIFMVAFVSGGLASGQVSHKLVTGKIDHMDYNSFCPGLGVIDGTIVYNFTIRYSESGKLESIHWNIIDCNVVNDKGDKVIIIDSGHDTYGPMWELFNNLAYYNAGFPIYYDVEDGWLNDILPDPAPVEGTMIDMSAKVLCKGLTFRLSWMMQVQMNANGDMKVNFSKP